MDGALAWQQFASRYGAVAAGLLIGTAARYGLTLTEGGRLTWRSFLADMLLLGLIGIIAITVADTMALTGNMRVLIPALAAVSSDRLVRMTRTWFLRRVANDLRLPPDTAAEMRGDPSQPTVITATDTEPPPMRAALRRAYQPATGQDAEMTELVARLGSLNAGEEAQ